MISVVTALQRHASVYLFCHLIGFCSDVIFSINYQSLVLLTATHIEYFKIIFVVASHTHSLYMHILSLHSPPLPFKVQTEAIKENRKFQGIASSLGTIWREEGVRGYFKGNGTNVVRIIPYMAVQFAAYEEYKKVSIIGVSLSQLHNTSSTFICTQCLKGHFNKLLQSQALQYKM